jgi:putative transposase
MQVLRGFKYKLKLNLGQNVILNQWIGTNRCLYNIALMQRTMNNYREHRIGYKQQAAELPNLKKEFPWMKDPPSQTLQQTLMQVDLAFQRFFKGESSFPKPKKKHQESGIKFPTPNSIRLISTENPNKGLVELPKIGVLRFRKSRKLEGELRSCTISKGADGFYISFLCRIEMEKPVCKYAEIGIDRGVIHTLAFSSQVDGTYFKDLPLARIKRFEQKIELLQKGLSKKKRYSKNWKKLKKKIGNLHHRIACIRRDFLWKVARTVTKSHGFIVIEDLKTKNMTKSASGTIADPGRNVAQKSGLNRAILRQGWHMFSVMLEQKAEEFGSSIIKVDPKYSSQECSECEFVSKDNRQEQSVFHCKKCQHQENADTNAAKIILARGRRVIALKAAQAG